MQFDKTYLGIELGSTRIKAVLLGADHVPIASGSHTWESRLENGYWTYHTAEVWEGLRDCYRTLKKQVKDTYGVCLQDISCMGVSAMMHGYLPFDAAGKQLVSFRTWRNTTTAEAAEKLTQLFHFNIPQRWSIAHLYQAMLDGEPHVPEIRFLTTLAGYVHRSLTGENVLGVGEASGMFPIDTQSCDYDEAMLAAFDEQSRAYPWKLRELLPKVLPAGANAGCLSAEGALLLDPDGDLRAGIPFCPPEGDAATGMVATNAICAGTGNVSAGTSVFSMVVLEKPLKGVYPEIDLVTTPVGLPVAMVHCNNCTTDMNAWVSLFGEVLQLFGIDLSDTSLFPKLYQKSLEGAADCNGIAVCNYLAGEPVTGFTEGIPLFLREPAQPLLLADFLRAHLYSSLATLKIGMDLLRREEISIHRLMAHGGLFKTPLVGQRYLAAATEAPVCVMETAGEGGPYGMALLAAYCAEHTDGQSLESYLSDVIFTNAKTQVLAPDTADVAGFRSYLERFERCLAAERAAISTQHKEEVIC